MKLIRWLAISLTALALHAAVPAPPQLFPQDTLLLLTVPDWVAMHASTESAPLGRLWADPAMKPFRDKFETQFREKFLGTLEKDLGIKAADFLPLLQGQVSFAIIKADWDPSDEDSNPTMVLVVDSRDKADQLKTRLTEVRQKLSEAKKTVRTEKIRDLEFTTVEIERAAPTEDAQDKDDPDGKDDDETKASKLELTFGQADSAFLLASSPKGLDRLVARLTGGTVPVLGDSPDFQSAEAAGSFRDATAYGFLQTGALLEALQLSATASSPDGGAFGIDPKQAVAGLGLDGLRSVSASARQTESGLIGRTLVAIPAAKRNGLFKILQFEAKDASPPAFVPAEVVSFGRFRLNGQQLWSGLEALIQQVSPQLGGLLNMSLGALGKDKDPNFDFRKRFFGNLGDDYISYERAARGKTLPELQNRPSLSLLGAVNANEMLSALRTLASLLPGGGEDIKEREVNGKKIFSMTLPSPGNQPPRLIEFSASGGYVAFANDAAVLEEFLRSSDGGGRPLKESPGLAEAAQQVGGMSTGFFSYQNQRESVQATWEALRTGGGIERLSPGMTKAAAEQASEWLDFSLLPPFEQMAKYFGIAVSAGAWDSAGFQLKTFAPTPK
ncbi:MAG TPA: hypothetical protein PLX89_18690 [Verrucomicrobiota bacterium]|nr:hypothetical protein [Verrucomicrobiales bacterium]HRI15027.1 hypothetical protein [Verrucomicrobiota bacterium]